VVLSGFSGRLLLAATAASKVALRVAMAGVLRG
jgi:hypothetical protein